VVAFFVLAIGISAKGASFVFNVGSTIPDEDLNGIQNSQTISGFSGNISDVNVTLEISGGFNGDFYAYLSHNNTAAILLNRSGRSGTNNPGYPDGVLASVRRPIVSHWTTRRPTTSTFIGGSDTRLVAAAS
jgi:subtilisin-like proprotein convertase family protein